MSHDCTNTTPRSAMTLRVSPDSGAPATRISPLEPVPVSGCGVCAALAEPRRLAWMVGNISAVAVQNAELRNHPHDPSAT